MTQTHGASWLTSFRRRLIPVIAAVAITLAVVLWMSWKERRDGDSVPAFALHTAQVYHDYIQLSWEPVPEATAYQVVIYQADKTPLKEIGPVPEPSAVMMRRDLPDIPGVQLSWQVFATNAGREVAASDMGSFTITDKQKDN